MNSNRKLAAFIREAVRDGVLKGNEHPFTEAAMQFTTNVDILGVQSVDQWFAANEERSKLVDQVFEAYYKEDEPDNEPSPAPEADKVIGELSKLQDRVKQLEEASKQAESIASAKDDKTEANDDDKEADAEEDESENKDGDSSEDGQSEEA